MVYSAPSQRHVAEQIETMHWNLVSADSERAELDTVVVRRDADLTDSQTIESLPEDYDDLPLHPEHEKDEQDAQRYEQLRAQLLDLYHRRDALTKKLAQYDHLHKLLEPLSDPQTNVQPNLVTRDGELSQELDRTRILLARVTGKVAEMGSSTIPQTTRSELATQSKAPQTDRQKLAQLMELT